MVPSSPGNGNPQETGSRVHLERALSKLGLLSRGRAATAIQAGEVTVGGKVIYDPRRWVDWRRDAILWSGERTQGKTLTESPSLTQSLSGSPTPPQPPHLPKQPQASRSLRYGVLHKPAGALTTFSDELGRQETVYALLPPDAREGWLFPVGRLDKDSEGLLLFTNDGPWASALTGPESHFEKVYRVKLDGRPGIHDLAQFRTGIELDGSKTQPCEAEAEAGNWVRVVLREGRNRQIRRMFHTLGYKVKRLMRTAIGPLVLLEEFKAGEFRWLSENEVASLRRV
jgi:pseudouridine synthase